MNKRKKYRRYHYKIRRLPLHLILDRKMSIRIWYWGSDPDWGKTYCASRTEATPNWCIRGIYRNKGYSGFDYERNRWCCRSWSDKPNRRLRFGWRYKVYG